MQDKPVSPRQLYGARTPAEGDFRYWTAARVKQRYRRIASGLPESIKVAQTDLQGIWLSDTGFARYLIPTVRFTKDRVCLDNPGGHSMGREERDKTAGNGRALTKELALNLLAVDGSAAIWLIHLTAAKAHRQGHPRAAQILIEIADVAEQEWLRNSGETSQFSSGSLGNRRT